MKITPVQSPSVKNVQHDHATNTMRTEFHSGEIYEIQGLTQKEHAKLLRAPSVGSAVKALLMRRGGKKIN